MRPHAPLVPRYAPVVVGGTPVRRNALWGARRSNIMSPSAHSLGKPPGCEKGRVMIAASQLAILVSAIALVCVVSMMLYVRGEATRKRVAELERRVDELSSAVANGGR